jgi:hypothetical protein
MVGVCVCYDCQLEEGVSVVDLLHVATIKKTSEAVFTTITKFASAIIY